jgi:hypothetical protein
MALLPDSAAALIDELDRMFPEKASSPESTRDHDLYYGGKRDLILFLKEWRERTRSTRHKGQSNVRR